MSRSDLPAFTPPTEDARALLARLYREIGVSAVATALQLEDAPEAQRTRKARETLAKIQEATRRILAA